MPPRRPSPTPTPAAAPPLGMTAEEVVSLVLGLVLDGKHSKIYSVSKSWGRPTTHDRSNLEGDRKQLQEEHAQPLIDAGLLYLYTNESPNYYALTPAGIKLGYQVLGRKNLDVGALLAETLDTVLFGPSDALDGRTAIPYVYDPSKSGSKLVLVLGENAGGKSLFRRLIRVMTHPGRKGGGFGDPPVPRGPFPVGEVIGLSMQGRTSGGFERSCVYGEESYHSTGENSAHTVAMGIKTACERNHTAILYWDEPDIGMSGGAAAGAGVTIREFIQKDDAPLVEAVFLTSHSPALIRQLRACDPHYIFLGDANGPKTLDEWFEWQQNPTPVTPEQLKELAHKRYRDVQAVLNRKGS
jgi:hypothetical protein